MTNQRLLWGLVTLTLIFGSSAAIASEGGIGFYTAVSGQVSVMHPATDRALPVKLHDEVLFKDLIQTQDRSRTKAFFQDDSMLTVGENSRVEIDEYIYNPDENVRRAIVKLVQGQVRALVSKVFKANGSKFEIHTPSAVAAARGTYFTVWVENGRSGIINIGEKGRVDFTSGGTTVAVDPGFFSVAQEGQAPSIPLPHYLGLKDESKPSGSTVKSTDTTALKAVTNQDRGQIVTQPLETIESTLASGPVDLTQALAAVDLTTLREEPFLALPAQTLQALNLDAVLVKTLTSLTGLSTESLSGTSGGTTTGATGTVLTGSLTVGPVSVGTTTTSGLTASIGSLSVGSVSVESTVSTVAAPLAPVISTVTAPLAPVISTVTAPLAPVISTVVAPLAPVISPIVAPLAPVISPVVAPLAPVISPVVAPVVSPIMAPVISPVVAPPVTPLVTTILSTPPAVINGALSLLK